MTSGRRRDGKFVVINPGRRAARAGETELFGKGDGDFGKLVEADGGTLFSTRSATCRWTPRRGCCGCSTAPSLAIKSAHRAQAERAGHRRGQPRPARLIREGLFRGRPLFPPERGAGSPAATARAGRGHPDLARAFLLRANREGLPAKTIDAAALERLKAHAWPANVESWRT